MTNKIKNDDIEKMITEIRKMRKDIQLVVLNLPEIDSQNPTQLEQYILQHHSNSDQMLESLRKTSSIPYEFSSYDYPPEDLVEILTTPEQLLIDNKLVLTDKYGKCVNIRQGCRVTTYQPDTFLNTIYFTDGCRIYGIGNSDSETIPSYLQNSINEKQGFKYLVRNFGQLYGGGGKKYMLFPQIEDVVKNQMKPNDILVLAGNFKPKRPQCHFLDSQKYFKKPYKYGECFFEELPHLSRNATHLISDCLFDFMIEKKLIRATTKNDKLQTYNETSEEDIKSAHPVLKDDLFMQQLHEYKEYLKAFAKPGICGGICMNANPFTFGHRFLVETAASQCDHLYIFVAEENRTMFPFKERFRMIKEGTADISNVTVIHGGIFVGSIITFPEYYDREVKKSMKILPSLDLLIFADHLCPPLNITKRFVGTEPICPITNQFNIQLKTIFPKKGIELIEFQRKEIGDNVVSASRVREILKQWEEGNYLQYKLKHLKEIVPPTTFAGIERLFYEILPKE